MYMTPKQMKKKTKKLINDIEGIIAQTEFIGQVRPQVAPQIDLEGMRVALAGARKVLAALERGDPIDPAWLPASV